MKRKITESQLKQLITNKVRKYLNENSEKINPVWVDDNEEVYYIDHDDDYDEYGVPNIHSKRTTRFDDPEDRISGYNGYRDKYGNQLDANKERLHTLNRQTDAHGSYHPNDNAYFSDGDLYPSAQFTGGSNTDWVKGAEDYLHNDSMKRLKSSFDKQWQDTKDKEKYEKQADSRPLHRKGSLNRAMDESKLHKIVANAIKKVINESK